MGFVEEDSGLKAPFLERPLRYTYDDALDDSKGFRFVYEQGAIRCSKRLSPYATQCRLAPEEINALGGEKLKFVYLDCGRWGGTEYSFGLVCGRDVYLCEYVPGDQWSDESIPELKNEQAASLINQLWALNCGVRILKYAQSPSENPDLSSSKELYLLIPDFHMPPISWYFSEASVAVFDPAYYRTPPDWFCQTAPYRRHRNLYNGWYGEKSGSKRDVVADADIFGRAGSEMVIFLRALSRVSKSIQAHLHVFNLGDMAELWLNRSYQFEPGKDLRPNFVAGGLDNSADWVAEVMLGNMEVIEAQRALAQAGIAEIQYLWGNHDAYLMSSDLCSQVGLASRVDSVTALGGELHVEHGHRFDSSNFDNIKSSDGPFFANAAFYFPSIRKAEPLGRGFVSIMTGAPEERHSYYIGGSLLYFYQKFVQKQRPFSIFCMGHTHARMLGTFTITGRYQIYDSVQ